jgi:NAD-dependent SIR2 family protein deacetylase
MVVVMGTSGQVIDTAYIAKTIKHSILNNLDQDPYIDKYFKTRIYEPATVGVVRVVEMVEEFLEN